MKSLKISAKLPAIFLFLFFIHNSKSISNRDFLARFRARQRYREQQLNAACHVHLNATERNQTLTSPGWPRPYHRNARCEWTITAPDGLQVRLHFLSFHTEICCDHLEIFDGGILRERLRGKIRRISPIVSASGSLVLEFHSNLTVQHQGFRAMYSLTDEAPPEIESLQPPAPCGFNATASAEIQHLYSPRWPQPYANSLTCVWNITAREGKQVKLDVNEFFTESCCDKLKIFDGGNEVIELRGNDLPPSSIVSSYGFLVLRFTSDGSVVRDGFEATFIETDDRPDFSFMGPAPCGFEAIAISAPRVLNSPNYPQLYPKNTKCTWIIRARPGFQVALSFSFFDTEGCCDKLHILDGQRTIAIISGDEIEKSEFVSKSGSLILNFNTDNSKQSHGFRSTFRGVHPETALGDATNLEDKVLPAPDYHENQCEFDFVADHTPREITSPNWPETYSNHQGCIWRLFAPPGEQVILTIHALDTEECCDTLMIFDRNLLIRTLRGSNVPSQSFWSTSGKLVVRFHSDVEIEATGFQAYFIASGSGVTRAAPTTTVATTTTTTTEATTTTTTEEPTTITTTTTEPTTTTTEPTTSTTIASAEPTTTTTEPTTSTTITAEPTTTTKPTITTTTTEPTTTTTEPTTTTTELTTSTTTSTESSTTKATTEEPATTARPTTTEQPATKPITRQEGFTTMQITATDETTEQSTTKQITTTEEIDTAEPETIKAKTTTTTRAIKELTTKRDTIATTANISTTTKQITTTASEETQTEIQTKPTKSIAATLRLTEPTTTKMATTTTTATEELTKTASITTRDTSPSINPVASKRTIAETTATKLPIITKEEAITTTMTGELNTEKFDASKVETTTKEAVKTKQSTTVAEEAKNLATKIKLSTTVNIAESTTATKAVATELTRSLIRTIPAELATEEFSTTEALTIMELGLRETTAAVPITSDSTAVLSTRVATSKKSTNLEATISSKAAPTVEALLETANKRCGFNTTTSDFSRLFSSPNFPQPYPPDSSCIWRLSAPDDESYIMLGIDVFDTQDCCDTVQIYDGGILTETLRGSSMPFTTYQSRSQSLEIHFTSDSTIEATGFQLSFLTSSTGGGRPPSETEMCGFLSEATHEPQFISSPNWPEDYLESHHCEWTISGLTGMQLQFNITSFHTEECCDYLEFIENGATMLQMKGKMNFTTFISDGNNMTIIFNSDGSVKKSGFQVSYALYKKAKGEEIESFRCYSGIKVIGNDVLLDEESESPLCGGGSSCMEVTATGREANDHWSSSAVHISIGQCVPNIVCGGITCTQVQNRVSPLIAKDFENCNIRCCQENMCNRPQLQIQVAKPLHSVSAESIGIAPEPEPCIGRDVNFLPGCTYKELHYNAWLCSSLFFNSFPYLDVVACSENIQLYRSCLSGMISKCNKGSKQPFVTVENGVDEKLKVKITQAFGNLTTILQPSYDVFCERNEADIESFSGGIFTAMDLLNDEENTFCNTSSLNFTKADFQNQIRLLIRADAETFCVIYPQFLNLAYDVIKACLTGSSEDVVSFSDLRRNTNKLLDLLPNLLEDYVPPKCIALQNIESAEVSGEIPLINFTTPDAKGCYSYNLDMMLLIDGSGSVGRGEFPELLKFVKNIASSFDMTRHNVGLMQYSHYFAGRPMDRQRFLKTEIHLGEYKSRIEFSLAVDAVQHHGYTTYTAHAIQKATQVDLANSRRFLDSCTKKAMVIVTDGSATDLPFLSTYCNGARALGIELFAVGVKEYVVSELQLIASGELGNNARVYTTNSYYDLVYEVSEHLRNDLSDFMNARAIEEPGIDPRK